MELSPLSPVPQNEIDHLRELARVHREYAELPIMKERENLWYNHNEGRGDRPPIVMEIDSFGTDLLPAPRCGHPVAIEIERLLQSGVTNHELVNDDKVVPRTLDIPWAITTNTFGVDITIEYSPDQQGRHIGFGYKHPIGNLETDFHRLKPSQFKVDRENTKYRQQIAEDIVGSIMPVRLVNKSLDWYVAPSKQIVELMGMERLMMAMVDTPERVHALYLFLTQDIRQFLRWQEREGLLNLNNENNYAGAGSYGFSRELNRNGQGPITTGDIWGNMNSQETVGISPRMFKELIFPYYRELAGEFALVYFGCCEPVHDIWDNCISRLPNLRKVSVSAWCDEIFMGEALRGSKVIYSRKPSPNFIGVGAFDEEEFARHITNTLHSARGCSLEILFRDIYTLNGDRAKPGRAVNIVRNLIDKKWK